MNRHGGHVGQVTLTVSLAQGCFTWNLVSIGPEALEEMFEIVVL